MKKTFFFLITFITLLTTSIYSQVQQDWVQRYNGPVDSTDGASSIAVDGSGNVYVTGRSYGSGTSWDYATIKYNSSGVQQWVQRYNGPGNYSDIATSIAVDGSGNVYVTGGSYGSGTVYDYATVKYSQQIGIKPISTEIPKSFSLYQNYPNPFNPSTTIKFDIPLTPHSPLEGGQAGVTVTLVIFDILGREVAVLINEPLSPGTYEVDWNGSRYSSGIYFYKLITDEFTETKRMVLVK